MVPAGAPGRACRINSLPSHVLTRAIYFLDAHQLVQTCVLSRRWRHLWRSFDGMAGTWVERNVLFKKFFNRFLMLRNPTPLDEFNLWYQDANLWIGHALQCNARSVNVSVSKEEGAKLHLDPVVFTSECFPTSLGLTWVLLLTGFFENLQMGCTLLERLKLHDCSIYDAEISSQSLKLFTIEAITPLLTNMGSLETATVSIGTSFYDTPLGDICQFLRGLSDVTHLDLRYRGPKLKMEKKIHWCPKFNNLTILTLGDWCLCANFYALIVFLHNSPNLMKLILKIRKNPDTHEKFIGELEERYFSCEHLKVVEIFCPEDWEDDPMCNDLEKILVGNGISLKSRMVIKVLI
ncbi:hypothetical protein SETIT_9G299300v2 [Setaria italica]|uniref:F-box domain-containing protein n=1 Tax=Setaria italica TaxID=4555 RepID=A0A368SM34_SETIT|nr:hypothetical protein SETIT_9G299300v2 [Setaria italica]